MLQLFSRYTALFDSWQILRYEQEGESYLLHIKARLCDGSWLVLRDYLFQDGSRKYSYHWMNADETFRRRWDNAPHWPTVPTSPHHEHRPDCEIPGASVITNLEDLFAYLEKVIQC